MPFQNLAVSVWPAGLAATVPILLLTATALTIRLRAAALRWCIAEIVAATTFAASLLTLAGVALYGTSPAGRVGTDLVRADLSGSVVLALVTFIGWVIVRYSRGYLAGDPAERVYLPALLGTLAAVTTVIVGNHLILIACAWLATSMLLHRLLTLYPERPAALIAAHKKFLASRIADLLLAAAIGLTMQSLGTLYLDDIAARLDAMDRVPPGMQLAAVLLVLTAILKCAQLPIHGWLIQVMESPTPVSALLHAGVVNLGGFVLIRLAELIGAVPLAQGLLMLTGGITAILATLVSSTRIGIKVALAWSTCAQMGFMLMQIGLGLYELALLHLVAHSLYKAHAFLAAGSTVEQVRIARLSAPTATPLLADRLIAAAAGLVAIALAHALWPGATEQQPGSWVMTLIAGLSLTPLVLTGATATKRGRWRAVLVAFATAIAYIAVHALATTVIALPEPRYPASALPWLAAAGFALLFALQQLLAADPTGALASRLHPLFYAGFFLDELFTRVAFRVWPARLRRSRAEPLSVARHPEGETV